MGSPSLGLQISDLSRDSMGFKGCTSLSEFMRVCNSCKAESHGSSSQFPGLRGTSLGPIRL